MSVELDEHQPSLTGVRPMTPSRPRRRPRVWRAMRPYVYVGPSIGFLGVFLYIPLVLVVVLSFFRWNLITPWPMWVGLDNYREVLSSRFIGIIGKSVEYVLLALVGNFLFPIGLAMLTRRVGHRMSAAYQTALFAPTVVAAAVGALVWSFLLLPNSGPVNTLIEKVGIAGQNWLGSPSTALLTVSFIASWKTFGFNFVIALAGLAAIPQHQLEAARMDGASGWRLVRYIVLPLLAPTLVFLLLVTILQAMPNVLVIVQLLTTGGPGGASTNLLYQSYRDAIEQFRVGQGAAEATILIAALAMVAICQFRLNEKRVHYGS